MKCLQCGSELMEEKGSHLYCANDGVAVILEGVTLLKCQDCNEESVAISQIASLNKKLAVAIAKKNNRLSAGEIRFLRKYLGWSGVDFARNFGVAPETVSRWETGAKKMGSTSERLLRMFAINMDPVDEYPLPKEILEEESKETLRISLGEEWRIPA